MMYIYIYIITRFALHISSISTAIKGTIQFNSFNCGQFTKGHKLFRKHQTHGMVRGNEHIAARRMQHHSDIQGMWIYVRVFTLSIYREYNKIYQILYYT